METAFLCPSGVKGLWCYTQMEPKHCTFCLSTLVELYISFLINGSFKVCPYFWHYLSFHQTKHVMMWSVDDGQKMNKLTELKKRTRQEKRETGCIKIAGETSKEWVSGTQVVKCWLVDCWNNVEVLIRKQGAAERGEQKASWGRERQRGRDWQNVILMD